MQRPIERAWELQQRWSTAATVAHERIDRLRAANLVVLVVAAVVGAASALLHDQQSAVRALGVTTAVLLGAAGLVQQRYIGGANVAGWVETRLASERLKSAVWRTLGTGADPASVEADLLAQIDAAAADFARLGVTVDGSGEPVDPLPMVRSVADYKAERADGQASWHRGKIATLQRRARRLRNIELAVTIVGVGVSALAAWFTDWILAPIVGALTTIAAAVAAHLSASKYERIAAGYASTASRLDTLSKTLPDEPTGDDVDRFVDGVERILTEQNAAWVSLLGAD